MTHSDRIELAEDLIRHGVCDGVPLRDAVALVEALILEATLSGHAWNVRDAAPALGLSVAGVYKAMRRLGIAPLRPPGERPVPDDWRERLAQ